MPAFLCETGFLTNPTEEKYLASSQGQDQIAHNIFNAVRAYKNEAESDKGFAFTDKPDTSGSHITSVPITIQVDSPPHVIARVDTTSKPTQDSIRYKVQFYSSTNSFNYQNYVAIKNITTEMLANGKTRYLSGNFTTLADAEQALSQIRASGFKDAFVVEYKNGVRLPKVQ
jgi:N-acetylmuramoyl-L-alanine amidase